MPRRSSVSGSWSTSRPLTSSRPDVGSMRRLIILRVVVFPQPEGPMSATIEPALISRFRAETASELLPSKRFVTSCSRMAILAIGVSSRVSSRNPGPTTRQRVWHRLFDHNRAVGSVLPLAHPMMPWWSRDRAQGQRVHVRLKQPVQVAGPVSPTRKWWWTDDNLCA